MNGKRLDFRGSQKLADPQHHVAGVVAPLGRPPLPQLLGKVAGRLSGERRVGGADALPLRAVTGCARDEAASGIAVQIQGQPFNRCPSAPVERQSGIKTGNRLALARIERLRDPAHLGMAAAAVRISFKLPFQIAGIEIRQPRGTGAVAAPVEAVAGKAGIGRAGAGAAQGDDPPVLRETIERARLPLRAPGKQGRAGQEKRVAHGAATLRPWHWFRLAAAPLLLAACKPPPDERHLMPTADAARGRAAIARAGCGSCHTIPGVDWPKGKAGPMLDGLRERALIAGTLPNRPDVLAAYIRNAPALVPGSGMPAMPVSEAEARDIAAYLYEQGAN